MHDPKFLKLEGSWRGLHYLVQNSETGTSLKLRVLEPQQARARPRPQPGHRVRPEPAVQEDLRERVRHARRRALRRADRRLRMDEPSGRSRDVAADVQHRRRRVRAVHLRGGRRHVRLRLRGPNCPSRATSPRSSIRSSSRSGAAFRDSEDSRFVNLVMPRVHRPPALRQGDQADRRVRLRGSADGRPRQGAGDGSRVLLLVQRRLRHGRAG